MTLKSYIDKGTVTAYVYAVQNINKKLREALSWTQQHKVKTRESTSV
jgi:hypothetical protein